MVSGPQIPFQKIGTVYQNPAWRFEALQDPFKYSLKNFISCDEYSNAGHLKRALKKGITRTVTFLYPEYLLELCERLSPAEATHLKEIWTKDYRKNNKRKLQCTNTTSTGSKVICWNVPKLAYLNDAYFLKIANHMVGIEGCSEITFALTLKLTPELSDTLCPIGYMIYAGVPDKELAKRWKISIKKVEAIRMLFFDFSHFPNDRIARWALLNQLKNAKCISDTDFTYYKRVYDLGELGLKAQIDYLSLTDEEKCRINDYLASSMIINTLDLQIGIKTAKDSLNYTRVVTDFARLSIEKEELKQRTVQTELMQFRLNQMSQQASMGADNITPEDQLLLEKMRQMSLEDAKDIPYVSIENLK